MDRLKRFPLPGVLRRWLLALLACGVALLLVLQASPPALSQAGAPSAGPAEIRGVWLTANDMPILRDRERTKAAVSALADLHLNTLYPVVWNDGIAYYPSAVSESRGLQSFTYRGFQGQDILADLLEQAHGRGLLVIPWFEFGLMTPPGGELARRHPDWLTQRQDGGRTSISAAGEVAWLNPFRPEVQQLIRDLVLEVVGTYDVDGIQFDDHMSLPREFGYDPFTIAAYRRETGRPVPPDPADPAWVKWRADRLTALMEGLAREVRSRRPGAIVSVSPNYYDHAYKLQLQDWLAWVRRGVVDELVIQIYRPDVESFLPHLGRAEVLESQRKIPVSIGIMAGQRNRPVATELIEAQVQAARERQLGVAFFYLESLWIPGTEVGEGRAAALRRLFPTPAPRTRIRPQEAGLSPP